MYSSKLIVSKPDLSANLPVTETTETYTVYNNCIKIYNKSSSEFGEFLEDKSGFIRNCNFCVEESFHNWIIDFEGNKVEYSKEDLFQIKHAYAITIHKSQGSEFELVIMPISSSYRRMLYKKLIYTGITRAKKRLILIGEPQAFVNGVRNNNERVRKTNLLDKLLNSLNKN